MSGLVVPYSVTHTEPAIDGDDRPRDVRTTRTGEKVDHLSDLFWLCHACEWYGLLHFFLARIRQGSSHVRFDWPWSNDVDRDRTRSDFACE